MFDDLEFNPKGNNLLDKELEVSGLESRNFLADIFTGGAYSQNKYQKELAERQNEYNDKVYKFEGEELERQYNYAVQGQDIRIRNTERDLRFQEASRAQQWNYGMAIRDYEHKQNMRAYEQSVQTATAQKGFNVIAEDFANLQQDRTLMEQQLDLQFDQNETLLNYTAQSHGLVLQKRKLKTDAASSLQQSAINALKAKGQSTASGQSGRSAAKSLNAIHMEARAAENDIVNSLMNDLEQVDMELLVSRQQNAMDNLALELSKNNLIASDQLSRSRIKMQRVQADLDAEAAVLLKPEIAPPLPKPFTLPRPEYQEIYKPRQGPEPMEAIPFKANLGAAFFNTALSTAATISGMGR